VGMRCTTDAHTTGDQGTYHGTVTLQIPLADTERGTAVRMHTTTTDGGVKICGGLTTTQADAIVNIGVDGVDPLIPHGTT
jgi:hypothetical protein